MSNAPFCNQPFEARKGGHLRVRDVLKFPHPEVRALASLEGPLTTHTVGAK